MVFILLSIKKAPDIDKKKSAFDTWSLYVYSFDRIRSDIGDS
jgi:hypothetical protein